jgi:2-methylcitrate dehydratase PrpD
MAPYDVAYLEQPVDRNDLAGMAAIRQAANGVPVMADEALSSIHDAHRLVAARAADVFCIKLYKHGGITPARKIATIAEAANIKINCGGLAVQSQLEAAAGAHFYASRPLRTVMPAAEFIFGLGILDPDPLVPETDFVIEDGHVRPPSGPGLGVTVSDKAVEAAALRRETVQTIDDLGHSTNDVVQGVTVSLARWAAALQFEDIPEDVVSHMKTCVLDGVGCAIFGAGQPWGRIAAEIVTGWSGGGKASLFLHKEKVSPPDALANGTALHGFEIDDIHVSSSYHLACVTLPTVLAIGEAEGNTGREIITALVAGYEVGIRLGIAAGTSHSTSGYHVTGTVGAVGAATAAARLLNLGADAAAHAIGIGATQAAGLYSARLGAMAKRFHAGRAAQSGVVAAYLAKRGFTGSLQAIEAPFGGFLSTMNGQSPADSMLEELGSRWETRRVGFKIYAACASAHTIIDALEILMQKGLTADNLGTLSIGMSRKGAMNVGWNYQPTEVVSAQMNGSYAAAVKLIDGMAFVDQYHESRLADPHILSIIERVHIRHDPDLDSAGAAKRHAVKVRAELQDGRQFDVFVEQRRGSAERPLSLSEIQENFAYFVEKNWRSRASITSWL